MPLRVVDEENVLLENDLSLVVFLKELILYLVLSTYTLTHELLVYIGGKILYLDLLNIILN